MKRGVLLVNPRSGRGDGPWLARRLLPVFAAHGWRVWVVPLPSPPATTWLSRQAAAAHVDAVFLLAGDGTLRWVVRGLLGTSVPLGLLPNGTGNVLARYLHLPLPRWWHRARPLARAVEQLLHGRPQAWDMVRVNRHLAVLWVGWGMDAWLVHRVEGTRPRQGGRSIAWTWARFIGSTVLALGRHRAVQVRGTFLEPGPHLWMMVFASLPLYAGGVLRFPQGRPDDGWLEAWWLPGHGLADMLGRLLVRVPALTAWPLRWPFPGRRFRTGRWQAAQPLPLHADGDPLPPARTVTVRVYPHAWQLLVP